MQVPNPRNLSNLAHVSLASATVTRLSRATCNTIMQHGLSFVSLVFEQNSGYAGDAPCLETGGVSAGRLVAGHRPRAANHERRAVDALPGRHPEMATRTTPLSFLHETYDTEKAKDAEANSAALSNALSLPLAAPIPLPACIHRARARSLLRRPGLRLA